MQAQRFDINKAPVPPLRAEPRPAAAPVQTLGVEATSGGLIRSTLMAAAGGVAILTFFWLPAEYGIDPTGVGGVMGLTEMGDIKQQLYAEAAADDAAAADAAASAPPQAPVAGTDPAVLDRLAAIETQLAAIADVIGAAPPVPVPPSPQTAVEEPVAAPVQQNPNAEEPEAPEVAAEPAPEAAPWRDEVSYTLPPGEGIEIKLVMQEGAVATFEWSANGGVLNYDTHADGSGQQISYEQGRAVPDQAGTLTAAFTGNHGWFWRNRSDAPVTLTLRTAGDYAEMKAP